MKCRVAKKVARKSFNKNNYRWPTLSKAWSIRWRKSKHPWELG